MPLRFLLNTAWNIVRHNRLLWILSLISVIYSQFSLLVHSLPKGPVYWTLWCISLPDALVTYLADYFMVYAVERCLSGQPALFREGWETLRARMGRLVLASLLWILLVSLVCVLVYFITYVGLYYVLYYTSVDLPRVQRMEIIAFTILFVGTLLVPIIEFSYRAIYLYRLPAVRSLKQGCLVYARNIKQVLLINLACFALNFFLIAAVSLVYFSYMDPAKLHSLAAIDLYQQWITLAFTPVARWIGILFYLLFFPFLSTLMTLLYLHSPRPISAASAL